MRIYEGSPRQDFEEVFRSIGAFIDQRAMHEVLLVEAPDGFIVQGIVVAGAAGGAWSESLGAQTKETLTFLDDDIARFMEESVARRGKPDPGARARRRRLRDGVPRPRPLHGRAEAARRLLLRAGWRVRRPAADGRPDGQQARPRRIHQGGHRRDGRPRPCPAHAGSGTKAGVRRPTS